MATTTEIRAQIGQLQTSIAGVKGQLSGINANINQLRQDQTAAQAAGDTNQATLLSQQRAVLAEESTQLSQTLRGLEGQLATAQVALGESQNQVQAQNQTSTNADGTVTTATSGDANLNPPVRTIQQVQASTDQNGNNVGIALPDETGAQGTIRRNPESGELYDTGGLYAPTAPGVGANDDSGTNGGLQSQGGQSGDADAQAGGFYGEAQTSDTATVSGTVTSNSRPQIKPQPNVLDRFSSYTYRLSVYLMTPTQYAELARSRKKVINGYNLLFQSGGAPTNVGGFQGALANTEESRQAADGNGSLTGSVPTAGAADAGRNPAFPLDFYIDSCTIMNLMQGKATGTSHSVAEMKFTVIEPVGITLIDRIYEAVQDSAPAGGSGKTNYQNAQYLMVIRFYGYDQNGNLISNNPNNSDPRSVIEKYIPFMINKINWRVTTKATEYEFECTPIGQIIAGGTRRGVVPYDIQLSQGTVGKLLSGDLAFVSPPQAAAPGQSTTANAAAATPVAPAKANAASTPKRTVKSGLMAAMNEFTQELTKGSNPIYEIADTYEIVFAKGAEAIRDATIVLPGDKTDAKTIAMGQPPTANANSADPDTQRKDTKITTKSIYAGQPIVQVIDQVIRNSSYITNQAVTRFNTGDDSEDPNGDPAQKRPPVDWYRISFEAVPIGNQQDSKRRDYAYRIRYIISAYRIDNYDSKYFPLGVFRGVHKSYPWIFSGQNTAVLDYSETLNSAYNLLVSGSDPANSATEIERRKVAATMRELVTYTYGPRSGEASQGSRFKSNEVGASIADSLYGGADLAETKLRIIGDPAWIQQGSLASGIATELFNPTSFLPDGTINFDAEQIAFEVNWNRPSDYNLSTGLADPNAQPSRHVSRVYTARSVTTEFRQGRFEQVIDGLLFVMPKQDGSNRAPGAAMPTQTENQRAAPTAPAITDTGDETARLLARTRGSASTAAVAGGGNGGTNPATISPGLPQPAQTFAQRQAAASESYRRAAQQTWGRNRPQPGSEDTPQVSDPTFSSWDP